MILIADSGSTKTDWVAFGADRKIHEFTTSGFNPLFNSTESIITELKRNVPLSEIREKISAVYFFGAGCSSTDRNKIVFDALTAHFPYAISFVEHDMLGCALAVCDSNPGLACILGTGSNICFFDGHHISDTRHGLGYVLGDEGSGSYFGKKLLSRYLYGLMPQDIETAFTREFNLTKEDIIRKTYKEPNPNVFLASFARFLSDHPGHHFIRDLVHSGFTEFFETNVLSYPESRNHPVHFVGSIAHFFADILNQVAEEKNIELGKIIRKPITGLTDYFMNGGKIPQ